MEDKKADVGVWHGTTPPAFMPLSERAKAHMSLPEHCDGLLLLEPPERALGSFPADYKMRNITDEEGPHTIAVGSTLYATDLH